MGVTLVLILKAYDTTLMRKASCRARAALRRWPFCPSSRVRLPAQLAFLRGKCVFCNPYNTLQQAAVPGKHNGYQSRGSRGCVCKVLYARADHIRQLFVYSHFCRQTNSLSVRTIHCSSRKEGSGKECRLLPPRTDREPRTRQSYALQLRLGSKEGGVSGKNPADFCRSGAGDSPLLASCFPCKAGTFLPCPSCASAPSSTQSVCTRLCAPLCPRLCTKTNVFVGKISSLAPCVRSLHPGQWRQANRRSEPPYLPNHHS